MLKLNSIKTNKIIIKNNKMMKIQSEINKRINQINIKNIIYANNE